MPVEHKYFNKTRNNLCVVLADGGSGLSSNCVGDYTETWTAVSGAAEGSVALLFVFTVK